MTMYRLCSVCSKNVPYGTKCKCEIEKEKKKNNRRYKRYRTKRDDIREQRFYVSGAWISLRENLKAHQFSMDLIDWYKTKGKGEISNAETYHHIIELKDNWELRLTPGNIIGLTQRHHMQIHALMNRSIKDKLQVQKYLKKIIYEFENEFY